MESKWAAGRHPARPGQPLRAVRIGPRSTSLARVRRRIDQAGHRPAASVMRTDLRYAHRSARAGYFRLPRPADVRQRPSDDAELFAFRVAHYDGPAAGLIDLPGDTGAGLGQPLHLLADRLLARLAANLASGHPDV